MLVSVLVGCTRHEAVTPVVLPMTPVEIEAVSPDAAAALILPDLMELVVARAAGVLLAAADQHAWNYLEPCSDDAWRAVVDAAAQLAQTVATLSRSALVRGRADWLQWAAAMREGADTGTAAARRHGPRVLFAAGAQLRAGCQACHARYVAQIAEPLAEIASR